MPATYRVTILTKSKEPFSKAIAGKERTRLRRIFVRLQEAITGA
jgi:hypothetical protein